MHFAENCITVIEHTKACPAQCLNSDKRITAFGYAVNDIFSNITAILELLVKYETWCPELEGSLDKIYNLPRIKH